MIYLVLTVSNRTLNCGSITSEVGPASSNFTLLQNLGETMQAIAQAAFPKIHRILVILLVIPVATATVERDNSALAYVKTDLCSMMGQGCLQWFCYLSTRSHTAWPSKSGQVRYQKSSPNAPNQPDWQWLSLRSIGRPSGPLDFLLKRQDIASSLNPFPFRIDITQTLETKQTEAARSSWSGTEKHLLKDSSRKMKKKRHLLQRQCHRTP